MGPLIFKNGLVFWQGNAIVDASGNIIDSTNPFPIVLTDATGNQALINNDGQLHIVSEGKVDTGNSSSTPLGIGAIFTGTSIETLSYAVIVVSVYSDKASATDGLSIEQSSDNVNWDFCDVFTIPAAAGKTFSFQPQAKYLRVVYTNGAAEQTAFRLSTTLKKTYVKPSSHRIQDSIIDDDDAELVKAVVTGQSSLSGIFENVTTYRGALDVNSAWLHRKIVNETFHQDTATSTTLNTAASEGDTSIIIADTTGFVVTNEIQISENGTQEIGLMTITAVAAGTPGTLTLDRPLGNDYTTSAIVKKVISNMAVDGTLASPEAFEVEAPIGNIWQITRVLISLIHSTDSDDSKFAGLTALTNGVCLRATTSAGRTATFANWKTDGDMKLDMYDVKPSDRAPAGKFGTNGRWTFTRSEVVAELDGDASPIQKIEVLVQDALSTLVSFKIRAQGRVFKPQ